MSKNINNHTDKHTVPRHKEQGSNSKAKPTRFLNRLNTRSIVAGATWICITCFGGAAGRGPKNNTKP